MSTDIDPGFARDEALVRETLFARARELRGNDPLSGETILLSMVKEDPHVPTEAVYILEGPANPRRVDVPNGHSRQHLVARRGPKGIGRPSVPGPTTLDTVHPALKLTPQLSRHPLTHRQPPHLLRHPLL
jgi:hypothetical protein